VHTVTKVLVVFAAILCVLLAALTMAYSVNADRIVADHLKQVELRTATETTANNQLTQAAEEQARLNQDIQQANNEKTQLGTQISSLQQERQKLLQDVANAVNARDAIVNQTEQAITTSKTQALLIQQYRDEVTKLRESELNYRKREIELADRINDLESQREVLEQSTRALQEQLAEARRTIETGGTIGAVGQSNMGAPIRPSFAVSGRVVSVGRDGATNKPIATINVGTNNQVRDNMQLIIVRGDQFLANFLVKKADLQWAQGEIDTLGKNVTVQEGDTVRSLVAR
jgi:hypothetical protein